MLPALGIVIGFAIAAIGGFFIGRSYERSHQASTFARRPSPETDASTPMTDRDRFLETCREGGTIVVARLDAVAAWRKTHGQATIDHLSRQVREAIATSLDPRASVGDGSASELILLALPDPDDVTFYDDDPSAAEQMRRDQAPLAEATAAVVWPAIDAVRRHRFVDREGHAVHATASFGAVRVLPDEDASAAIARASDAAGEAGRFGRNGLAVWTSGGIRRIDPPAMQNAADSA